MGVNALILYDKDATLSIIHMHKTYRIDLFLISQVSTLAVLVTDISSLYSGNLQTVSFLLSCFDKKKKKEKEIENRRSTT